MEEKLKTNVKEKPILATVLIGVIIGLLCLIIFVQNYYQAETELPPKLILKTKTGEEVELLLLSYDWTYKGENKTYNAGIEDIMKYDFEGKNTILDTMEGILDVNDKTIETSPKYKAQGYIQNALYYKEANDNMTGSQQFIIDGGYKFNFVGNNTDPTVITIELNSDKQGKAVYALKYTSCFLMNADKIKAMKKLEFDEKKINKFLQEMNYGQYLENVEIQDEELTITYEYYISEDAMNVLSQGLFALIDEVEKIHFDFTYDKYVKTENDKNVEFNKIDTVTYDRLNFKSFIGMTIEEFKEYINR